MDTERFRVRSFHVSMGAGRFKIKWCCKHKMCFQTLCHVSYRQLSEENANLQEHVERESSEKKRLSRNNDELLWLLQTSPHLSPSSSPSHRVFFPGPEIPPPGTPTHSHSYSPGPCNPSYRAGSPGPGTPTYRGSAAAKCSPGHVPNANTLPR